MFCLLKSSSDLFEAFWGPQWVLAPSWEPMHWRKLTLKKIVHYKQPSKFTIYYFVFDTCSRYVTWLFFFSLESTKPLLSFPFQFKSSQVTCSYHPVTFDLISWCMLTERSISAVVIIGLLRDYTIFQSHWGLMLLIPSFVVTCISTQDAQSYSFTKRISSI